MQSENVSTGTRIPLCMHGRMHECTERQPKNIIPIYSMGRDTKMLWNRQSEKRECRPTAESVNTQMLLCSYCASCEQPADDSPARNDVWTQHFIGWMNHGTDVTYQVTPQWLAFWRWEILQQRYSSSTLIISLQPITVGSLAIWKCKPTKLTQVWLHSCHSYSPRV